MNIFAILVTQVLVANPWAQPGRLPDFDGKSVLIRGQRIPGARDDSLVHLLDLRSFGTRIE